jgi:hypothetical protein
MHTAYPYTDEIISIAKHYPNVWVDLCWAWSINPYSSTDFVRRFLHAVPANKLFAFGGDTFWPTAAIAYSIQARKGLQRALEAEVATGDITETEAIALARRLMRENQYDCFDIEGTRAAVKAQLEPASVEWAQRYLAASPQASAGIADNVGRSPALDGTPPSSGASAGLPGR